MNIRQYGSRDPVIRLQFTIKCYNHLRAELRQSHAAHERNNVVPNEPFIAGVSGTGPMNVSTSFLMTLKEKCSL